MLRVDAGRVFVSITDRSVGVLTVIETSGSIAEAVRSRGSIDAFDVRGDTVLAIELLPDRLQEATVYREGRPAASTTLNEKALSDRRISEPEPFAVRRPDGTEIDAWLVRPLGADAKTRCPAVLTIHGGPRAAYSAVFFHQMQAMAGRGYAVIICNPRGSSGRGNEFADLRAKYGKIDYDDLMAVLDEALARYPFLDTDRLGVMGGSYGGFMTNWIIGQTDRFRAAVSQRSIANWISKFNTTDIGYYFNKDQIGTDPWADGGAETLWWHSPLRSADRAVTPTLFIHSDEDLRCWLVEGLQMFTALRYHGVETRLVMFRGENHELSRSGKPKHRMRRLNEIVGWFDRYLARTEEVA